MIRVIHADTSVVTSAPNEVIVKGPDGVDVSLTPAAAMTVADDLVEMAAQAAGKQVFADSLGKRIIALTGRKRT